SFRYGVAAVALFVGVAAAPAHGVAWADSPDSAATSSASVSTDPTDDGPKDLAPADPAAASAGLDEPGSTKTRGGDNPDPDADTDV
ncbi:hypothetical protein C6A85_54355, partial [Mycobacterium sp. ITM-2017-0098]